MAGFPENNGAAAGDSAVAAVVASPVAPAPAEAARPVPVAPDGRNPLRRRVPRGWLLALLAGMTLVLGVAVPLAPVMSSDPVVSWPQAGQQPRSTVLPLSPYRPLRLNATIPCATVEALADRPGNGDVLRTVPVNASSADDGLTVTVTGGRMHIVASRRTVLDAPLSVGCGVGIDADGSGLRVTRDGAVIAQASGLPVPEVSELATDAQGLPAATGLAVRLHTDDRYASHPTALKTVLLVLHLLALAATLILAWRRWPGSGPGLARPRWGLVDAVFVLVAAAWVILGPLQYDDAWYELMARNASPAGYIGNYIYMFNATESPFVASQYAAQAWGALGGWSLWWMRTLPLLYGIVTWLLLRTLVATVLGRVARRRWVGWALLGAFLTWWLPYGMVLRPEPLIMLFSAAVLVLAELARRRRSVGALVAASAVAVLALTVSPSGLVAFAPLPLALPWLWRWLIEQRWQTRVSAVLALGAMVTAAVPIVFAVATLGDVIEAGRVHKWYYVAYPWYEEWLHYKTLLGNAGTGSWGRRAPVILTVAALLVVAIASGRRWTRGGRLQELMLNSGATTVIALALLGLSPTKAILHFGAVIAPTTVFLAACLLRTPLPRRPGGMILLSSVGIGITAAVMTFDGPNLWHPYSDRGMPFGDHMDSDPSQVELAGLAPHLGPLYVRDLWLWLALAAAVGGFALWRRRRGRNTVLTPDRGVLIGACTVTVVGMIAVFVYAPLREYPGWTVASGGMEALAGQECGLANDVTVLAGADSRLGAPSGAAQLTGDFAVASNQPAPVPAPGTGPVWHDAIAGGSGVGTLATPWYSLPRHGDATNVTVPAIGTSLAQQHLSVEFTTGSGAPRSVPLQPDPGLGPRTWQELPVRLDPAAVSVRVVAEGVAAGPNNWMAVAQPELTRPRPVTALTDGHTVFADQLTAALWPCVNQATVTHGMAQPPTVKLAAADGMQQGVLNNEIYRPEGGVWAHVDDDATYVRTVSTLRSGGPATPRWGEVERVLYDHPAGLVDVAVNTQLRQGWTQLPTLASDSYDGRKFEGDMQW